MSPARFTFGCDCWKAELAHAACSICSGVSPGPLAWYLIPSSVSDASWNLRQLMLRVTCGNPRLYVWQRAS